MPFGHFLKLNWKILQPFHRKKRAGNEFPGRDVEFWEVHGAGDNVSIKCPHRKGRTHMPAAIVDRKEFAIQIRNEYILTFKFKVLYLPDRNIFDPSQFNKAQKHHRSRVKSVPNRIFNVAWFEVALLNLIIRKCAYYEKWFNFLPCLFIIWRLIW